MLANQILNGAEADVFLSANQEWADAVAKKGFAAQTRPLLDQRPGARRAAGQTRRR